MSSEVLWVPAPPSAGSISMQRYFGSLLATHEQRRESPYSIHSLLPFRELIARRSCRLKRAGDKWLRLPLLAARHRPVSLVHALSQGLGHTIPWFRGKPRLVATVHDLIALRHPGELSPSQVGRCRRQAERLRQFDLILAVSAFTAGEIRDLLGIGQDRIRVVPNGVNTHWFKRRRPLPPRFALGKQPYILIVSSSLERKNLTILPGLMGALSSEDTELGLVKVGAPLPGLIRDRIERAIGPRRLIELGYVEDEELAALYQHAAVFFFPSRFEGFGMPILESMAAQTPVVAARATSIPEVGGNAALYFDPDSAEEAAAAVTKALRPEERKTLVAKGDDHVRKFGWDRHLDQIFSAYRELLA